MIVSTSLAALVLAASPAPTGDLYVASTPPGAAIFVDHAPVGQVTPFVVRGLPVGPHLVEVRTICGLGSAELSVTAQTIARAELTLSERPGVILVSEGPPGSLVFVDDDAAGPPPVLLQGVPCGSHTVYVRAPGYLEGRQALDVAGDERVTLVVAFDGIAAPVPPDAGRTLNLLLQKETFGTLVLDVTPLAATLDVDGIPVGAGPRSIDPIAAGPHRVTGELDGYLPLSVDVTVLPDTIARTNLTLVPTSGVPSASGEAMPSRPNAHRGNGGRLALDVGVSAVALGASAFGAVRLGEAGEAFQRYKTVASDGEADDIYATEVVPLRTQAAVGGGLGVLGLLAATGLWVTTEF